MQFIVPTLFGLEGLAGDELRRMQFENVKVEDRRVFFTGDEFCAEHNADTNRKIVDKNIILNIFINCNASFYLITLILFCLRCSN